MTVSSCGVYEKNIRKIEKILLFILLGETMLKLKKVTKKYKKTMIFKNINMSLPNIGCFIVKGKNGIGKTTLFNIISGFTYYKGRVLKNNKEVSYLFQNPKLLDYLTIKEHFELFDVDITVMNKLNLEDTLDKYPCNLSCGQIQRISFLLSIKSSTNMILLDEPFANVDEENVHVMSAIINEEKLKKLILIITHTNEFLTHDSVIKLTENKINVSKNKVNDNKIECSNKSRKVKYKYFKKNVKYSCKRSNIILI